MIDEASDVINGYITEPIVSVVKLYNSHVEDVAICAAPTQDGHIDTFVHFDYLDGSTVGSIDVQDINKKPENIKINGVAADKIGQTMFFNVKNDAELTAALKTIKEDSNYWNKQVVVNLAAGTYAGNYTINQYPEWNGEVGAGGSANNMTNLTAGANNTVITFVGETVSTLGLRGAQTVPAVYFTGNVTVAGWGNAGNGFTLASGFTTFENVVFDASNSVEANGEDYIALYLKAAASNVTLKNCFFTDATHVTMGGANADGVGKVDVLNCTFENGGCLSGYIETLTVKDTKFTSNSTGFIDKKKAGPVTVENCEVDCAVYFLRTDNSGVTMTVKDTTVKETDVANSKGTGLVVFRGSGHTASFVDCQLTYDTLQSGAGTGTLEILNYTVTSDGLELVTDAISGEVTLADIPDDCTTVTVPEGVTNLGNALRNKELDKLTIPASVTNAYKSLEGATVGEIVIADGATTIPNRMFYRVNVESVIIPNGVTVIDQYAFAQAMVLEELVIPASVTTIAEAAFTHADDLATVTIMGDTDIEGYAFRGCDDLRTVYLNGTNVNFVKSTLNGRNSTWFCNGESNNPNTSNITFYVKNDVIKERVLTAMGAERNNTPVVVEQTADSNGVYEDAAGNTYSYANDNTTLGTAIAGGAETVYVSAGNFTVPAAVANKTVVLEGAGKDTVIDFTKVNTASGATITFRNMHFQGKNENVMNGFGIQGTTGHIAYENCTFDGAVTNEYFGTVSYKDCTFTGTGYITTYAVKSATFENCVFDKADSRAVLVYSHGDNPCVVTINGCEFKAAQKAYTWNGDWTAAIEVDTTNIPTAGTSVTITDCTYDANYSGLYRDKSAAGKANAVITVVAA